MSAVPGQQEPAVRIEIRGEAALLTIDRPQAMNALDLPTLAALDEAWSVLERNDAVRAIIVTGGGERAFVAGGDIADLKSRSGFQHHRQYGETIQRLFARIEACDKPTIAAVNGWALGGGAELLLCLDLRIAAEGARIGLPEVGLGLFPGAGGTQRLIRQLPYCRALELLLLGQPIAAASAAEIGLINRVVPAEALIETAFELAHQLSRRSPVALKMLKRTLRAGRDMPLGAALQHELAMVSLLLDSRDAQEGCQAFLDKRPPRFIGE